MDICYSFLFIYFFTLFCVVKYFHNSVGRKKKKSNLAFLPESRGVFQALFKVQFDSHFGKLKQNNLMRIDCTHSSLRDVSEQ